MQIPADVPFSVHDKYIENYKSITKNTEHLMLFSADQKIEHLNNDFYGPFLHPDINYPIHIFNIANKGKIGALASHLGLISRYGSQYNNINYIIKLNAKTNLIGMEQKEPLSKMLWSVDDVINFKKNSGLKIRGVGYTLYVGSEFESIMLSEAAQIINKAHEHGLIAILWIYPRGKSVKYKTDLELAPGVTGIANSLGADFVKIKAPQNSDHETDYEILKIACQAAGNTKVICSGGEIKDPEIFLKDLYEQISISGTSGNATGRNIFQRSLNDAVAFTNAISAMVYENKTAQEAIKIYDSLKLSK